MSAPAHPPPAGKPGAAAPAKDPYVDMAERIYVNLAARVYGTLSGTEQKKPDPKALAAFCFKLVDPFEQASNETPRRLPHVDARNKAAGKLDETRMSDGSNPTA